MLCPAMLDPVPEEILLPHTLESVHFPNPFSGRGKETGNRETKPIRNSPSELRFDASEISFATLSSLKLPGIRLSRVPDSESSLVAVPCSEPPVPAVLHRLRASGEWVADLCRRMVEKRLTNEVLCLKLDTGHSKNDTAGTVE